jgi:tetratricopeptide (TPR) repeat protein
MSFFDTSEWFAKIWKSLGFPRNPFKGNLSPQYWLGEGMKHIKEMKPNEAISAFAHVIDFKPKDPNDPEWQSAYGMAIWWSGIAYIGLGRFEMARSCLRIVETLDPPNKELVKDLRAAIEKAETLRREDMLKRKEASDAAIEMVEATGGEKGFWLGKGYKSIESGMFEQAINAFNEVLKLCGLTDPKIEVMHWGMRFKDKIERDGQLDHVSLALLGLVLSYSSIAQLDEAKEYLGILDRINPKMAEDFRETWKKS